jgi:hypothetical protein
VSRRRTLIAVALVAPALALGACGGGDDEEEPATTPPPATAAPSDGAAPSSPSALPPQLVECFANEGFEITSPADIHSAPPEVVQACFGSFHGGGGAP